MKHLQQEDIQELDSMGARFGCTLCLPPCNKALYPFFFNKDLKKNPFNSIRIAGDLLVKGFSFFFDEGGNLIVNGRVTINGLS